MDNVDAKRSRKSQELVITDLLSYRLHKVASAFERGAALRFRREFDVSLGEWRALALIGGGRATTLNRVARLANIDPAQMSRIVSRLVERGFVTRSSGRGNSSPLSLTDDGRRTYAGLISAARARNVAFLSALTTEEIEHLDSALAKLTTVGIALEHAERDLAGDTRMRSEGAAESERPQDESADQSGLGV